MSFCCRRGLLGRQTLDFFGGAWSNRCRGRASIADSIAEHRDRVWLWWIQSVSNDQFNEWAKRFLAHDSDPELMETGHRVLRKILMNARLTYQNREGKPTAVIGIESVIDISEIADVRMVTTTA